MSFRDIVGQQQVKSFLQGNLRTGHLSHGYLFIGPKGSGKEQMARALAQAIYCDEQQDDSCGKCRSCQRFLHGNIVVFKEIRRLKDKTRIVKEQIQDLQEDLHYKAEDKHRKIYLIYDAHLLNDSSVSMMLKYLEEPGVDQLAILMTHNEFEIPATVLSRLQIIKFTPPNVPQIITQLQGRPYEPELIQLAASLGGSAEEAERLLQSDWFAEFRALVIELMGTVERPYSAVTVIHKRFAKFKPDWKKQLDSLARMLELMFRDLIYLRSELNRPLVYSQHLNELKRAAILYPLEMWIRCLEQIIDLRKKRQVNTNWQMLLEVLFIRMKER